MALASVKVQEKILMNKQLCRFENVVGEMKESNRGNINETKTEENVKETLHVEYEDYEDHFAAKCYDLGFLQSKLIKNVVCCLSENQQIGIILIVAVIKSSKGLFFLICVFLEISLLSSDVGMCILLYKTDYLYFYFAALLFLLKVSRRLDMTRYDCIDNNRSISPWLF